MWILHRERWYPAEVYDIVQGRRSAQANGVQIRYDEFNRHNFLLSFLDVPKRAKLLVDHQNHAAVANSALRVHNSAGIYTIAAEAAEDIPLVTSKKKKRKKRKGNVKQQQQKKEKVEDQKCAKKAQKTKSSNTSTITTAATTTTTTTATTTTSDVPPPPPPLPQLSNESLLLNFMVHFKAKAPGAFDDCCRIKMDHGEYDSDALMEDLRQQYEGICKTKVQIDPIEAELQKVVGMVAVKS